MIFATCLRGGKPTVAEYLEAKSGRRGRKTLRQAVFAAFQRAVDAHYRRQAALAGVKDPKTGAIAVIQRFNSALQTDVHIHVLYADGVWENDPAAPVFTPAPPLHTVDVQEVLWDAWLRIERQLRKFGWQDKDQDPLPASDPALAALLKAAVQGRLITGQQAGKPLRKERGAGLSVPRPHGRNCAEFSGFSLHADTRVGEMAREQLERLVRYVCRPAIAAGRIEAVDADNVRITLKSCWKDGTPQIGCTCHERISCSSQRSGGIRPLAGWRRRR